MEGLEASILPLSVVTKDNRDSRLDSQYFSRAALVADSLVALRNPKAIGEISSDIKSFGAYSLTNEFEYQEVGVPFLRGTNFAGDFISFTDVLKISLSAHDLLHKSEVKPGMVLLSMSGSVGSVAVAMDSWTYPINSNQDIAKIVTRDVDPYYLAAFLACSFGQTQIDRLPVGSIQQHVFLWMIDKIKTPRFSEILETKISSIVRKSYQTYESVSGHFDDAAKILLSALGLDQWPPKEPLSYSVSSSNVFSSGRIDAQYFRPLFTEIEQRLTATGRAVNLGSILEVNARGRQPTYDDSGLPVINSKHVRTNRVILSGNRTATEDGAKIKIQQGDVLLNGTGVGTIGRAAPYLHKNPALPDNHVTVLRSSAVDPVYLAAFLNSPLGQSQIERHIKGSSGQIELYPQDISKIVFWDAPKSVQSEVRTAVLSAFDQEHRSQQLMTFAKRALEIAIEFGEAEGLSFLEETSGSAL